VAGSGIFLKLHNNATGTNGVSTGLLFSTYVSDATSTKAGIFFRRNNSFGVGDLLFSLNNAGNISNVDASDANVSMIIKNTGHVGIGTTSPGINSGAGKYLSISATTANINSVAAIELEGGALNPLNALGRLDFNSANGTGTSTNVARIAAYRPSGSSYSSGILEFFTSDGTNLLERMRITEEGNVGIGTNSPGTSMLNVVSSSTDSFVTTISATNNYTGTATKFGINNYIDASGNGTKYGIYTTLAGTPGSSGSNVGYAAIMQPYGTAGVAYGFFNNMSGFGTGPRYGFYSILASDVSNTSTIYGMYSSVSKPAGSSGVAYGIQNIVTNNGASVSYNILGTSTGSATNKYGIYMNGEDRNYFSNNVGIGTTTPSATLQVNGTTRLVDGNQAADKILTSDNSGNATWQYPANYNTGFSVYQSGTYTFATTGANIVPFSNALYDDGGNFNLAANTYTVPSTGLYHFDASIRIDGYTAGQYTYLGLYVNGILVKTNTAASNTADFSLDISGDLRLSAGQLVTLRYYQSSSPHTSPASNVVYFFNGHRVY
jgi:hypothetical protein